MKKTAWLACVLAAAVLGGCSAFASAFGGGEAQAAVETLAENQREVYGKVTAANGNEITLSLGTLSESKQADEPEREQPQREQMEMEPPEGGGGRRQSAQLALTGGEETWLIPVGTPVYLSAGSNTLTSNFMQIMVDNTVRLVVQSDGEKETVVSATILS